MYLILFFLLWSALRHLPVEGWQGTMVTVFSGILAISMASRGMAAARREGIEAAADEASKTLQRFGSEGKNPNASQSMALRLRRSGARACEESIRNLLK